MDTDISAVQLRWSSADDAPQIEKLLEASIIEGIKKLFSPMTILKLIETSCTAITILGPDNTIEGFATFDDHPHVYYSLRTWNFPALNIKIIGKLPLMKRSPLNMSTGHLMSNG